MKTRVLIFIAVVMIMAGCTKEDRIVPDCSNPFFGLYSPYGQVTKVTFVDPADSSDIQILSSWWLGRRLMTVKYTDPNSESDEVEYTYNYDSHNRLSNIDSLVFFAYNSDGLLSSIKMLLSDRTRTLLFQYDDALLPNGVTDSILFRNASSPTDWYNVSTSYSLEWEKGNLVMAKPANASGVRYDYYYDDNRNPFCGLSLRDILGQDNLLQLPTFFSRNNVTAIAGYNPDGSTACYHYYDYECYHGWPQVVTRHLGNDSVQTYKIFYRY